MTDRLAPRWPQDDYSARAQAAKVRGEAPVAGQPAPSITLRMCEGCGALRGTKHASDCIPWRHPFIERTYVPEARLEAAEAKLDALGARMAP